MARARKLGTPIPWSSEDSANLRQWLASVHGQRTLNKLFYLRPKMTEKNDVNKRLIQSGQVEGYETVFDQLEYLATPASETPLP